MTNLVTREINRIFLLINNFEFILLNYLINCVLIFIKYLVNNYKNKKKLSVEINVRVELSNDYIKLNIFCMFRDKDCTKKIHIDIKNKGIEFAGSASKI